MDNSERREYQLGLYEKSMPNDLSLAEKLRVSGACGYDYLELSIDESKEKLTRLDWSAAELERLRRESSEAGVPIRSICLSGHRRYPLGHPDPEMQKRSLSIMEKAINMASVLGVRIIQLAGYDVYYERGNETTAQIFADNLRRSVSMAAERGVMLAFETMETPFMDTVSKAMAWVERIQSPYLQVYPDVGNVTNAMNGDAGRMKEDLCCGRGHLAAMHLKETRPGVYREVPYGTGHVDFAEAIETGLTLGVRLFVAEFWYMGQPDWKNTLMENRAFLTRWLNREEQR